MPEIRFLLTELVICIGLLVAMLVSYIIFLWLAQLICRGATLFLRILAFIQMLSLSLIPFVLTLFERQGLTAKDTGVRLLEELALHVVRYEAVVRPLMGYIGVYVDAFTFRFVSNRKNEKCVYSFSKVHDAACDRASSDMNTSWIRTLKGESGPCTAWLRFEHSKRQVLRTLTRAGNTRTEFGEVTMTPKVGIRSSRTSPERPDALPLADPPVPPVTFTLPPNVLMSGTQEVLPV